MRLWIWGSIILILSIGGASWSAEGKTPSFQEVAERALNYAHLEAATLGRWEKKVHQAPWLPRLQFGVGQRLHNKMNVNLQDSVSVNSSGVTVGPTQQKQVQNADDSFQLQVKAVWRLDELLFSHNDFQISNQARQLAHERERILKEVRESYFQRERKIKEGEQIEVAEAEAVLDGLTGGWFSAHLGEGQ